jgi:hypothetical protein
MSKITALQNALNSSGKAKVPSRTAPKSSKTDVTPAPTQRAPSRAGQVNISAWLNRDFKKSLRLVQARKVENASLQDLMAEALNDLFTKYDVPTVNQD